METNVRITLPAVRVNTGMSQKEWAKALGVGLSTVVGWETGKSEPRLSHLKEMSELSGIPIDYIFLPYESKKNG